MTLDEKDKTILSELKKDSSQNTSTISKNTRIPITTVHNRIKKLVTEGYITKYTIKENYELLNRSLGAIITIDVDSTGIKPIDQHLLARKLKAIDDVEEVFIVTGATDILVKVHTKNIRTLNTIILEKIRKHYNVKTTTMIILEEI